VPWPTEPEAVPARVARRSRALRRAVLAVMAVVVAAGTTGWLGVRTAERTVRAGEHELTVRYASVARAGLAAPWSLTVRRDGGFEEGETIRIRLAAGYFDLFDENGFTPDADASTSDGVYVVQEYAAPEADAFALSFDARIGPSVQTGERGTAALLDDAGEVVVEVSFRTWIVP
jgi:hypothetical protein